MELSGTQHIGANRQRVWDALNDADVLARCVPGCEEIVTVSDSEKTARVLLKMGPVRARFAGRIVMSDVLAPTRCTLGFEGTGGAAGFAKGRSEVSLSDEPGGTALSYTVEASVGGKLGQVGGRLISASAKKMADEFFTAFNATLTDPVAAAQLSSIRKPATPLPEVAAPPLSRPVIGGALTPELIRVMWFTLGAAFTWAVSRWMT